MSFDVFLQSFRDGEPASADRESVRALIARAQIVASQADTFSIETADGGDAEFSSKGLASGEAFEGCAFLVRSLSPELNEFIFRVAQAGGMVLLPAMEPFLPILTSADEENHLPRDAGWPTPVVCESPQELGVLLEGGFRAWEHYRRQIVDQP